MERGSDICTGCGARDEGIRFFGTAYRKARLRNGHPDPGNLCGTCAGRITAIEIVERMLAEEP